MKFLRLTGIALAAAMLLGLGGCTEGGTPTTGSTPQNQLLICYNNGYDDSDGKTRVFNSEGKLIAQTSVDGYEDAWTMMDEQGRQTGVALSKRSYSDDEFDEWGNALVLSVTYSILDTNGNEVSHVTIENPGDISILSPNGVANEILFYNHITDTSEEDGVSHLEVYDRMGELLLTETLTADLDDINTNNAYADYNGKLLVINHEAWDSYWENNYIKCYVFTKQGGDFAYTPLDKDYRNIYRIYDDHGGQYSYWQAQYYPTAGTPMYDILNPDGTIAIEGLNSVLANGSGMIFGRIGNELVLLDMQGNRLYSESTFNELDD